MVQGELRLVEDYITHFLYFPFVFITTPPFSCPFSSSFPILPLLTLPTFLHVHTPPPSFTPPPLQSFGQMDFQSRPQDFQFQPLDIQFQPLDYNNIQ